MQRKEAPIVFTFKESLALNRMMDDMSGIRPLNGKNAFENRIYMEKDFFLKLALFDKQKGEANVIDVNLERLKSLAEDGSISATLFNLYVDESLKGDLLFATGITEIEGQNLLRFDFKDSIKKDESLQRLAFFKDTSLDGKVFQQSPELQADPSMASLWVLKLYDTLEKAGFDPYPQIMSQVFEQGNFSFSDEVMNRWVIDQNFQEKLNQKDARFSFETREEKPVEKEITYLKKQA